MTLTTARLAVLISLTALATLSLNMFLPSLPQMAETFEVDFATISHAVAWYLVVTAVLQLVLGPLSDRYGRRPVLLGGLSIFACASMVCATTTSIEVFLIARMVQGAVFAGSVLALAVIRDISEPRRAAALIGYVSMVMAAAPMIGPMIGGEIDLRFGWRAVFWLYAAMGIACAVWVLVGLPETRQLRSTQISDAPKPSTLTLLRDPTFWPPVLCVATSTGAFFAFIVGAPRIAPEVFQMSPRDTGWAIGSITGGFLMGSYLSTRLTRIWGLRRVMVTGRIIGCAGLIVGIAAVAMGYVTVLTVFGPAVLTGLGNGVTKPPASAAAMAQHPSQAGLAAGILGAFNVAYGALMTTLTGYLVPADGPIVLLSLMLVTTLLSYAAAIMVRYESPDFQSA